MLDGVAQAVAQFDGRRQGIGRFVVKVSALAVDDFENGAEGKDQPPFFVSLHKVGQDVERPFAAGLGQCPPVQVVLLQGGGRRAGDDYESGQAVGIVGGDQVGVIGKKGVVGIRHAHHFQAGQAGAAVGQPGAVYTPGGRSQTEKLLPPGARGHFLAAAADDLFDGQVGYGRKCGRKRLQQAGFQLCPAHLGQGQRVANLLFDVGEARPVLLVQGLHISRVGQTDAGHAAGSQIAGLPFGVYG